MQNVERLLQKKKIDVDSEKLFFVCLYFKSNISLAKIHANRLAAIVPDSIRCDSCQTIGYQ